MNTVKTTGIHTRKAWGLRGRELEIVRYRDDQGLRFEEIAVLVGASKPGVIGAYKRGQKALGNPDATTPGESAGTATAQGDDSQSTGRGVA